MRSNCLCTAAIEATAALRSLAMAAALLVWATAARAAPPATAPAGATQPAPQMQPQAPSTGLKAGPPTLNSFSINNGAAKTADRTLLLTWTLQGQATHWRLSTSPSFPNTPWNPMPAALPFKLLIPEGTADGPITLHMQLLNDRGQSAVKSAQIEYLAAPKITAISVVSTNELQRPYEVRVTATVSGKVDRFRVTQSQAINFKEWIPAPASGPLVTTHWVTGQPPNSLGTLWLHVQRDGVGQHSQSKAVALGMQRLDYVWSGNEALAVLQQAFSVAISKLTPGGGECAHFVAGSAHSLQARAQGGPLRCRFTLFGGQPLRYGWTLDAAKVSYGDGSSGPPTPAWMKPGSECAIKELVTGGSAPRLAVEVSFPPAGSPTESASGWTVCQLDQLRLRGPAGCRLQMRCRARRRSRPRVRRARRGRSFRTCPDAAARGKSRLPTGTIAPTAAAVVRKACLVPRFG